MAFRFWPRRDQAALREPTFGVLMGFCCFLVAVMVFAADPMAPSPDPPGDGAGLGLYISHNIIVQKHKGKLTVDSKPGETCFTVMLPVNLEA